MIGVLSCLMLLNEESYIVKVFSDVFTDPLLFVVSITAKLATDLAKSHVETTLMHHSVSRSSKDRYRRELALQSQCYIDSVTSEARPLIASCRTKKSWRSTWRRGWTIRIGGSRFGCPPKIG